jgi:hypothetical protein
MQVDGRNLEATDPRAWRMRGESWRKVAMLC